MGVRIRGGFVLDEQARWLTHLGDPVAIEPKPLDLIAYLLRHRDRVVSKQELHEVLWPGTFVSDAALAQCVARARRALRDRGPDHIIRTVHGRGFRLVADVAFVPPTDGLASEMPFADGRQRANSSRQRAPRTSGRPAHRAADAAATAETRAPADTLVRAALTDTRAVMNPLGRADAERVRLLRAALDSGGGGATQNRARLLAALAVELWRASDAAEAPSLIDAALAMARRLGDAATLLDVLRSAYQMEQSPDGFDRRRAMVAEMMDLVAAAGEALPQYWVQLYRLPLALEAGDSGEFDGALAAVRDAAERLRDPAFRCPVVRWEASRALMAGRLDDAERLGAEALALGWSSRRDAAALYSYQLLAIRAAQDRLGELEPAARAGLKKFAAVPVARAVYADLASALGHQEHARKLLRAEARSGFAGFGRDLVWLTNMVHYARVAARLRETVVAALLYDQLAPYDGRIVSAGGVVNGSVALYLGMLATLSGAYELAEAHFGDANVAHRRLQAPLWIALTGAEHARMLSLRRASGDAARAEQLRREALALSRGRPFAAVVNRHCATS